MRVANFTVTNFASYDSLTFDLRAKGLTLIHGPTGAGKSTLCDVVPWILWGRTAKGGTVDEVLSWPGDKVTEGTLHVELGNAVCTIYRSRGPKAKDNDLVFWHGEGFEVGRGKDIPDTQRLLNEILGVDLDAYLAGAYFHEFSQTAQFFVTNAKNRRLICEQLIDLKLPSHLHKQIAVKLKPTSLLLSEVTEEISELSILMRQLNFTVRDSENKAFSWDQDRSLQLETLESKKNNFAAEQARNLKSIDRKIEAFESQRARVQAEAVEDRNRALMLVKSDEYFVKWQASLDSRRASSNNATCKECGAARDAALLTAIAEEEHELKLQKLANNNADAAIRRANKKHKDMMDAVNPHLAEHKAELERLNVYQDRLDQLLNHDNPHKQTVAEAAGKLEKSREELASLQRVEDGLKTEVADLEALKSVVAELRGALISATISELQDRTNAILTKHFDAEIRVEFEAAEADKIEVTITKDGNLCSYTQLSKGQRQLLKLAFGVATMRIVANRNCLATNVLFFDEALDGLDDEFKVKAFGLLEELSLDHESVFCVEHNAALKSMFTKQVAVTLKNGNSEIDDQ